MSPEKGPDVHLNPTDLIATVMKIKVVEKQCHLKLNHLKKIKMLISRVGLVSQIIWL